MSEPLGNQLEGYEVGPEDCSVSYRFQSSLGRYGDACLTRVVGEIVEPEKAQMIGRIVLLHLDIDSMTHDGYSPFEAFDISSQTFEYADALLGKDGEWRDVGGDEGNIFEQNFLAIDRLEILPAWRGRRVGLAAMHDAIRRFAHDCRVVALIPSPLQKRKEHDEFVDGSYEWFSAMEYDRLPKEITSSTRKLRQYYGRLGFVKVPRHAAMVLNPLNLPSLDQVLR